MKIDDLPVVELTKTEFDALPEYSLSVPTVNSPSDITDRNRRWKRRISGKWVMGSYSVDEQEDGTWLVTHWHQIKLPKPDLQLPRKLYDDIVLCLSEALESGFGCTCNPYYERDTNAWIHDEGKCWSFMESHVENTLEKLQELDKNERTNN